MLKFTVKSFLLFQFYFLFLNFGISQQNVTKYQKDFLLIVQPIIIQSDEGTNPASVAIPELLVDKAYEKANLDFYFLEPLYYNNTAARDGHINLDIICQQAERDGFMRGQEDIVNMFFVNSVDGLEGPLGRGMMGGNITFIALGDSSSSEQNADMEAFVIAHEVGHNLSLQHAVDDPNVPDSIPNIQGDGDFADRINPKYSLNDYQINIIKNSPLVHARIELLSVEKAQKAILDESFEPYFSKLQIREIETFIGEKIGAQNIDEAREYARQKFSQAVLPFTEQEERCLKFTIDKINNLLNKNQLNLMANHPWKFIKIDDWLCGGFAHTRGNYIILSQKHLDFLMKHWSSSMTNDDIEKIMTGIGALIVHEQMHCLQRSFPDKFEHLNTEYWNFVKANIEDVPSITLNQVSNPDAPIAEWLIPHPNSKNEYYWIRTLIKEGVVLPQMGKDFNDLVFEVIYENDEYQVKTNKDSTPISYTISHIPFYTESFPVNRGMDHPNEIAAYMFADYYKSIVLDQKPFKNVKRSSKKNCKAFIKWMKIEMK